MHYHFIAIGGSAMHNLAIALHTKGETVTGSDDEIFEPSRSRLAACFPSSLAGSLKNCQPTLTRLFWECTPKPTTPSCCARRNWV